MNTFLCLDTFFYKPFLRAFSAIVLAIIVSACDSSSSNTPAVSESSNEQIETESIVSAITNSPVDVMSEFVARSVNPARPAGEQADLFDNGGFESGLSAWSACSPNNATLSDDSYSGSNALLVNAKHCVYQSVQVEPGQELVLSCFVKGVNHIEWTGIGLGFSDESWNTLLDTPATIVSGTDYARYDVSATAPIGSSYVSMWFYSETDALLDDCTLLPANMPVEPPVVNSDNLLDNPEFNLSTNDQADNWQTFCGGGSSVIEQDGRMALQVFDGACVSQALSASDIAQMQDGIYELSCNVEFNSTMPATTHYATMSLTLDDVVTLKEIPRQSTSRVSLTTLTADSVSSGYVSIYTENEPGALKVFDCQLSPFDGNSGESFGEAANNLLANGGFDQVDSTSNLPVGWKKNCGGGNDGGTYTSIDSPFSDAAFDLNIGNDAVHPCAWTTAHPDVLEKLRHNTYKLSCDAWNYAPQNTTGNAWLDLTYSDLDFNFNIDRLEFSPTGYYQPFSVTGQFDHVTHLNIEIHGTQLKIDNCFLEATSDSSNRVSIDVRANTEGFDSYHVTGPFTFDVHIKNDGNLPLEGVAYASDLVNCDGSIGDLAAGASVTQQCTSPVILDENNNDLTMSVNVSATATNGVAVSDMDTVNYNYRAFQSSTARAEVKALTKTVLPGQDAIVEVTVTATGQNALINAVFSNIAECARTYNPPLVAGQYDMYLCTVPNLNQDTTVNASTVVNGTEWSDTIYVYDQ